MDIIESILDAVDVVTLRPKRKPTRKTSTTFTVSAPMCAPIRGVYDHLYSVGIRGKWKPSPFNLPGGFSTVHMQSAQLTVSAKQTKYTGELLWTLAATWSEGLIIKGDPNAKKNQSAVAARGYKFPTPWKDKDKPWKQAGCTQSRR